jgi:SAM-dependent methyltransferase
MMRDHVRTIRDRFMDRDFWLRENLQYAKPNFRLRKCARFLNRETQGRHCDLLDVGCGPASLRRLLAPNISYHGLDIAIQEPAPYLVQRDFVQDNISFGTKRFDIVVALGVFEYMGRHQSEKFEEIARILAPGGKFVMSYINFNHFRAMIYPAYNNVQSIADLTTSLQQVFRVEKCFPVSHHWRHRQPGRNAWALQIPLERPIPWLSSWFAVEYFCVCTVPV